MNKKVNKSQKRNYSYTVIGILMYDLVRKNYDIFRFFDMYGSVERVMMSKLSSSYIFAVYFQMVISK